MFDDLTLVDLLNRASRCAEQIFERHTEGFDLTARQYVVLRVVSKSEGLSQAAIVAVTGIDRFTLAELSRRLAKKGLLQRHRNREDARAFEVRLTAAGRTMTKSIAAGALASEDMIYAAIGTMEREAFRCALIELILGHEATQ